MLNETLKAVDATLTESELQAIAKTAYGELLGRTCDDQRRFPHHAEHHSLANRAYADFYQRQAENGGHVPLLDGEEEALRFRGWPQDRIDRLKDVIQLAVDGHEFIKTRFIDHQLREVGFEPSDARRSVVRRALYPAYRDACLEAERTLQAAMLGVAGEPTVAASTPTEIVPTGIAPGAAPTPLSAKDSDCMSDFVEQAISDLMNDEAWVAKSGRQARSTVALFELLIGKKPFAAIVQGDLSTFKRKIRFLPTRYSMSDAGSRKKVLEAVAQGEARAAEAEKSGKKAVPSLSNRTINRHLSSLSTLLIWARGDGRTLPALSFGALQTVISKRKRARNQRPATSITDIQKMFALPVFTGCQQHRGGTGQIILRARQTPGPVIVHDAFYWIPLLLYYTGLRREEGCKLSVDDIHDVGLIPYVNIDFTEFGGLKNDHSVRPVPLHSELLRLGFLDFVGECRRRGYRELFPELRSTNAVQNYGDVYGKNVWPHLKKWGGLTTEATTHGNRHRFSTSLKAQKVFSEFRRDLMGQAGLNIAEERYSEGSGLDTLQAVVQELPAVTAHLPAGILNLPPAACRVPQPNKRRTE